MNAAAGGDLTYLALRVVFIGAIYVFIWLVARTVLRELRVLAVAGPAAAVSGAADQDELLLLDGGASGIPAGATWELLSGLTIGRKPGNGIEMDDPFLSGNHAEIVREAGEWWLGDLGSTNGTLLNGAPVVSRTALRPGDIVQFGNVRLQVISKTWQGER